MTPSDIIEALGGRDEVSALTGAKPNAVTQWRRAGIPPKYWIPLLDAASEKRAEGVNVEALRRTHPSFSKQAFIESAKAQSEQAA